MRKFLPYFLIGAVVILFFSLFIFENKLPIPSDTIIGLYHPFRDLYAKDYPNGIPFKNFLITDPVRQQFPWRTLVIATEQKQELPLWNPYNSAGTPLLANFQSAPFYIFNLLFFLFSFSFGWSVLILLQPLMAGIFMYLYLDNLHLNKSASFLGAVTFSFCGFSTSWLEWGTIVHTALWLPLLLLSIDKIFQKLNLYKDSKFRINNYLIWLIIFVFALSTSFFAGHLQTFFYLALISFSYFFSRWWQFGRSKTALVLFIVLTICFVAITVAQWFSTFQLILLSARSIDQTWRTDGWFIPWQNLIQFVAPDFFGNPTTLNYWGIWNYAEFIGYVGIMPLILAIYSIIFRRDKKTLFAGVLLFMSLLFSLPTIFAKIPFILQIPFLSSAQPTRLLFLTDFAFSILAALGINSYIVSKNKHKILLPILLIGVIFGMLWVFIFFGYKYIFLTSENNILVAKHNLYFPTLIFIAISVLFTINNFVKAYKFRNILFFLLIAISVFDLFHFFQKFTPFTNKNYLFPSTKAISFLQKQQGVFRVMSTDDRILPPNFSIMYHLQTLDGYDPLYLLRHGELMAALERGRPDINPPFGFNRIITPHNFDAKLIDLLGIKYVLSLSDIKSPKLEKVFAEGQTRIYKNHYVFQRTFLIKNIKKSSSKQETINAMFDKEINFKDTAVVENWDNSETVFAQGSASIVEYRENNVQVRAKNNKASFLVLMDTFYPTWHARICSINEQDCRETKIYLTNYNFRGVVVPAGEHKVIFENTLL